MIADVRKYERTMSFCKDLDGNYQYGLLVVEKKWIAFVETPKQQSGKYILEK